MLETLARQHIPQVLELWLNANRSAHPFIDPALWEEALPGVAVALPAAEVTVAVAGDFVQGFVGITDGRYIAGLFVHERCRSQGVGRRLLDHGKASHPLLELDVFVRNERAVSFYRHNGFAVAREQLNETFGHPEYHMVWQAGEAPR